MDIEAFAYPMALRLALFVVFAVSMILMVSAILSAKALGGRLGMGLKKIAAGAIVHASLYAFVVFLGQGWDTSLTTQYLRLFFLATTLFGSALLILGFIQIYKLSKELKLFY